MDDNRDTTMKYEDAMRELERIVAHLENEQPDIDTLGQQLRRAQQLLKLCRDRLTKTNQEITDILREQTMAADNSQDA